MCISLCTSCYIFVLLANTHEYSYVALSLWDIKNFLLIILYLLVANASLMLFINLSKSSFDLCWEWLEMLSWLSSHALTFPLTFECLKEKKIAAYCATVTYANTPFSIQVSVIQALYLTPL